MSITAAVMSFLRGNTTDIFNKSIPGREIQLTDKCYYAKDAKLQLFLGRTLWLTWGYKVGPMFKNEVEYTIELRNMNVPECQVMESKLRDVLREIDNICIEYDKKDPDYKLVKTYSMWRKMYLVMKYPMPRYIRHSERIDERGEKGLEVTISTVDLEGCPCHNCGYIVDLESIQIDHHKPKSGGGEQAIIKAFRHLGLTKGEPAGGLGQTGNSKLMLSHFAKFDKKRNPFLPKQKEEHLQLLERTKGIAPRGRGKGEYLDEISKDTKRQERYDLTATGIVILNFMIKSITFPKVERAFIHNLLNLRPLCSHCNGSKSNRIKNIMGVMEKPKPIKKEQ